MNDQNEAVVLVSELLRILIEEQFKTFTLFNSQPIHHQMKQQTQSKLSMDTLTDKPTSDEEHIYSEGSLKLVAYGSSPSFQDRQRDFQLPALGKGLESHTTCKPAFRYPSVYGCIDRVHLLQHAGRKLIRQMLRVSAHTECYCHSSCLII